MAHYGVVAADGSVDEAATEAERARQRDERGDALAFDFGPPLEEALANCRGRDRPAEPPTPAKPLRWSPLEPGDARSSACAMPTLRPRLPVTDDAAFYRERGFGGAAGFGRRPALLVVDLVNGFTDPSSPLGSDLDDGRRRDAAAARRGRASRACRSSSRRSPTTRCASQAAAVFLGKIPSLQDAVGRARTRCRSTRGSAAADATR